MIDPRPIHQARAWPDRFRAWVDYCAQVRAMVDRIRAARADRAFAIAAAVGIPRHGCCLHNASIDRELRGWCAGRPDRLKAARRAVHILNTDKAYSLGQALMARHYPRDTGPDPFPVPPSVARASDSTVAGNFDAESADLDAARLVLGF